jgi:hypothetical protein
MDIAFERELHRKWRAEAPVCEDALPSALLIQSKEHDTGSRTISGIRVGHSKWHGWKGQQHMKWWDCMAYPIITRFAKAR